MTASTNNRHAVLIVEDEPFLLIDAMDLAEEAGLRAYGARNAEEALRLLERHDDIKILFTDIQLEGSMDGLRLSHAVRERWPPVAIMITSGVLTVTKDQMPENGLFFPKPYMPSFVVSTLRQMAARTVS